MYIAGTMSIAKAKKQIIMQGKSLGFDTVKIASAKLPPHYLQKFNKWTDEGQHGEMAYLAKREKHNEELLPGAKSVISLAMNYFQGHLEDDLPNPLKPLAINQRVNEGRVARYAITRDYHKIIGKKLKEFASFIEENFDAKTRYYVDTGPVLERAYSKEAGVGYVGRNSCLISKEFGSWIFLAEIFTTLDLEPDSSEVKLSCGTCRRCVDLCPTSAINEDLTIDARKCISYLTIENRGRIPLEFRAKIGNWLYGCDICQDVCPHNAKAKPTKAENFKDVRIGSRYLSLEKILSLKTNEEFLELFAGTPLMRAKRRGLVRNACVVAGNSHDEKFLPYLQEIKSGQDEMLAEHAEWAIEKITSKC